jgi:UDP-glucuronate 4-epimerase
MSQTVLVTGAAGFIGSNLVEALARAGDRVVGLDNFDDYYDPARKQANVADVQASLAASGHSFELVEGDVTDRESIADLFERVRFDAVVHLAALAGVRASIGQAARYFDVNVAGTICLLDACVARGVPKFVFASTSSVYGDGSSQPFTEDAACDRPLAPYPASKRSAELLGYSYHNLHGLDFAALRFFTVYGPRNRPDMMAHMLFDSIAQGKTVTLYEGGDLKRDWTYVADIVQGVIAAVRRPIGYEIINLGRGEPVWLRDFVTTAEELTGKRARTEIAAMPAADVRETFANIDKARRMLSYEPTTSVREGMAQVWNWYLAR